MGYIEGGSNANVGKHNRRAHFNNDNLNRVFASGGTDAPDSQGEGHTQPVAINPDNVPALSGLPNCHHNVVTSRVATLPDAFTHIPAGAPAFTYKHRPPNTHINPFSFPYVTTSPGHPFPTHTRAELVNTMPFNLNYSLPTMSGYFAQPQPGLHFQPPVPDTTNGPMLHTYVPRHDSGPVFIQPGTQPVVPGIVTVPVGPVGPTMAAQQQHMIPQPVMPGPAPQWPPQVAVPISMTGPGGFAPEVAGIGKALNEGAIKTARHAYKTKAFEPQDFKPADDDPGREYPLRQLDGVFTMVSRATIDNLPCRWYVAEEGYFYAVRLDH